jgi:hypothetical protein
MSTLSAKWWVNFGETLWKFACSYKKPWWEPTRNYRKARGFVSPGFGRFYLPSNFVANGDLQETKIMYRRFAGLLVIALGFNLAGIPAVFAKSDPPGPSTPNQPVVKEPAPPAPIEDPNAPQAIPDAPIPAPKTAVPDPNKPIEDPKSPGMPGAPPAHPTPPGHQDI